MSFKIHHPRLLLLFLMIIGAITVVAVLMANTGEPKGTDVPYRASPTPAPLSDDDIKTAEDVLRQSNRVTVVAGDQPWTASEFYRTPIGGTNNAVSFLVSWQKPVESSGPWRTIDCQGTRMYDGPDFWGNITLLGVVVDLERQEVMEFGITSPWGKTDAELAKEAPVWRGSGLDQGAIKVYDLQTREVLYDGIPKDAPTKYHSCPPGKEDD